MAITKIYYEQLNNIQFPLTHPTWFKYFLIMMISCLIDFYILLNTPKQSGIQFSTLSELFITKHVK